MIVISNFSCLFESIKGFKVSGRATGSKHADNLFQKKPRGFGPCLFSDFSS